MPLYSPEFERKNRSVLLAELSHPYSANGTAKAPRDWLSSPFGHGSSPGEGTMQQTSAPMMTQTGQASPQFLSDDARWEAVVRRDRTADGAFIMRCRRLASIAGHPVRRAWHAVSMSVSMPRAQRPNRQTSGHASGADHTSRRAPNSMQRQ